MSPAKRLAPIAACLLATPASAASCRATMSDINFGTVSAASLSNLTATGTLTESCDPGFPTTGTLAICNVLMGGEYSIAPPHIMRSSQAALVYRLYRDPAMASEFLNPETVFFTTPYSAATGSGTITRTVYAQLNYSILPTPGTYTEVWSRVGFAYVAFAPDYPAANPCANKWPNYVNLSFTVSLTVLPSCSVSATKLTFPTSGLLTTTNFATATIAALCSQTTPYTVSLSAGSGPGATVSNRKMTGPGGAIAYQLYRDAGRTQVWGDTAGVDTVSGTGSGSSQALTVYGAVPVQTSPAQGLYSDTVVVTLTY